VRASVMLATQQRMRGSQRESVSDTRSATLPDQVIRCMRFDWITRISLGNLRPLLSLFSGDLAIDGFRAQGVRHLWEAAELGLGQERHR